MEPIADAASASNKNTAFRYITGRRGGLILIYENRQFRKFRIYKGGSVLWRCLSKTCTGFLTVNSNDDILKEKTHTCQPRNSAEIQIKEALHELKQTVESTDEPIPTLYKNKLIALRDQGLNLAADFPNFRDIKSGLYNKRNRAHRIKSSPSIATLEVDVKPVVDHEVVTDRCTSPLADPFQDADPCQDAEWITQSPRLKKPRSVLHGQRRRGQQIVQYMNRLTQMEERRITAEVATAQALSDIAAALGRNAAAVENISNSVNKIANAMLQEGIPRHQ